MPRFALRLTGCLLALALTAGASGGAGVWLDVPFFKQEKNGCGAAALAMVMQYWERQSGTAPGGRSTARVIQKSLYSEEGQGIRASAMERYLIDAGFRTFSFAGEWHDLEGHVRKGRPLIVALRSSRGSQAHYAVVAGLDTPRGLIYLNDPARGKLRRMARSQFEREWQTAGNWALLALPKESK